MRPMGWLAVHPLAIVPLPSGSRACRHLGAGCARPAWRSHGTVLEVLRAAEFPFLLMLSISLGLELVLIVYHKLLRLLA